MRITWIIIALVAVLLLAIGLTGHEHVPVQVTTVSEGEIQAFIEEEGKTRIPDTYLVTMPYPGRLLRVEKKVGDPVKKGEVIAKMDRADLQSQVDELTAKKRELEAMIKEQADNRMEKVALKDAKAGVQSFKTTAKTADKQADLSKLYWENMKRKYEAAEKEHEKKALSKDALEDAKVAALSAQISHQKDLLTTRAWESSLSAVVTWPHMIELYINKKDLKKKVYEEQLQQVEVQLEKAIRHLKESYLISPIDGLVIEKRVHSARELNRGAPILTVGDLQHLEVEADILTQEVTQIDVGSKVEIFGRSIGDQPVEGTVVKIYPQGFTKVSSLGVEQQRVKVLIGFGDREKVSQLKLNYRVQVRIIYRSRSKTLIVPRSALFRSIQGGWNVFVAHQDRAQLRSVQVGLSNDEKVEITSGVEKGEQVILNPGAGLQEGSAIQMEGGQKGPSR